MSPVLLSVLSAFSYIGGIGLLLYNTPKLLRQNYDEWYFMLIAAADIVAGLLIFAPIGVTFALFNASLEVRIADGILLIVMIGFTARLAYRCFRPYSDPNPLHSAGVVRLSGILAGSYCLLLIVAALYALLTVIMVPM